MTSKNSVSTYLKSPETAISLEFDYILALLPVIMWSIIRFKINAALLIFLTLSVAVVTDVILKLLTKKRMTAPSLQNIYGALVFSLTLYPETSPVIAIVGAIILSILFNILNSDGSNFVFIPLIVRAITFSILTNEIHIPDKMPYNDILSGMLPSESPVELILGTTAGTLGSVSVVAVLMGGLYLILRKSSDFRSSAAYILCSIILSLVFPIIKARGFESTMYELLSSEILFITFFVLTDMQTAPKRKNLRYLKGTLCAVLTFVLKRVSCTIDCFFIGVVIIDLVFPIICMLLQKIRIAKECKNAA